LGQWRSGAQIGRRKKEKFIGGRPRKPEKTPTRLGHVTRGGRRRSVGVRKSDGVEGTSPSPDRKLKNRENTVAKSLGLYRAHDREKNCPPRGGGKRRGAKKRGFGGKLPDHKHPQPNAKGKRGPTQKEGKKGSRGQVLDGEDAQFRATIVHRKGNDPPPPKERRNCP